MRFLPVGLPSILGNGGHRVLSLSKFQLLILLHGVSHFSFLSHSPKSLLSVPLANTSLIIGIGACKRSVPQTNFKLLLTLKRKREEMLYSPLYSCFPKT